MNTPTKYREELVKHWLKYVQPQWEEEDIRSSAVLRIAEAYMMMVDGAKYRPGAPSDGFGNIVMSKAAFSNRRILLKEAIDFAIHFRKEEDTQKFYLGCTNFRDNRTFVFCLEAARMLCSGDTETCLKLLELAKTEIGEPRRNPFKSFCG